MEKAFTSLQGLQFSALRLSKRSADPAIRGRKWRRAVDASWGEVYFTDIAPENCPKERNNSFTYYKWTLSTCGRPAIHTNSIAYGYKDGYNRQKMSQGGGHNAKAIFHQ